MEKKYFIIRLEINGRLIEERIRTSKTEIEHEFAEIKRTYVPAYGEKCVFFYGQLDVVQA